jgi:hypothetical protein
MAYPAEKSYEVNQMNAESETVCIHPLVSSPKPLNRSQWNLVYEVAQKVGRICVSYRRDSEIGILSSCELSNGESTVLFSARRGGFHLHQKIQTRYGDHPSSYQWVPGTLSPEVKRLEREAYRLAI